MLPLAPAGTLTPVNTMVLVLVIAAALAVTSCPPTVNTAVNAVLGEDLAVALLVHYFKGVGLEVVALDEVCTQGNADARKYPHIRSDAPR